MKKNKNKTKKTKPPKTPKKPTGLVFFKKTGFFQPCLEDQAAKAARCGRCPFGSS
jgi:hypothetical protein